MEKERRPEHDDWTMRHNEIHIIWQDLDAKFRAFHAELPTLTPEERAQRQEQLHRENQALIAEIRALGDEATAIREKIQQFHVSRD